MTERVVKAILDEMEKEIDERLYAGGMMSDAIVQNLATAAMRAMREPTEAVLQAGAECVPSTEDMITTKEAALEIWQAMIDEALKS